MFNSLLRGAAALTVGRFMGMLAALGHGLEEIASKVVDKFVPGIGNTEGRQTTFKDKTQTRESARRRRRGEQFGASFTPAPHAAKPAPGTAQPLPLSLKDQVLYARSFSDGTYAFEENIVDFGLAKAKRNGTPKPYKAQRHELRRNLRDKFYVKDAKGTVHLTGGALGGSAVQKLEAKRDAIRRH